MANMVGSNLSLGKMRVLFLVHRGINTWAENLEKVPNLFKDLSAQELTPSCPRSLLLAKMLTQCDLQLENRMRNCIEIRIDLQRPLVGIHRFSDIP